MRILTKSLVLLGGIVGKIMARSVNFSIISFGVDVKLNVGGNVVPMLKNDPTIPLWTVTTEVPDDEIKYFFFILINNIKFFFFF